MNLLEVVSDEIYKGFFVDLYVRCANRVAVEMYEGMGYSVYRRVREYYGNLGVGKGGRDEEDAFGESVFFLVGGGCQCTHFCSDMRKPLSRDKESRSVRENGRDFIVNAQSVS